MLDIRLRTERMINLAYAQGKRPETQIQEPGKFGTWLPKPEGIGGWLVVFSIFLVWSAFVLLSNILLLKEATIVALLTDIGMFTFLVFAAIRFFGKKSGAPLIIIVFLAANILHAFLQSNSGDLGLQVVRSIINLFWILYFLLSKRVNTTFYSSKKTV